MELAADAGISDRPEGRSAPHNGFGAAAPATTSLQLERSLQTVALEGSAHDAGGPCGGLTGADVTAPPMPPDAPAPMTEQTLERWSLGDLIGTPRLGRLLSAVQRAAG